MTPEETWREAERCLGVPPGAALHVSPYDPSRRTYRTDDRVTKVDLTGRGAPPSKKLNTLSDEYDILCRCASVRGVPRPIAYYTLGPFELLEMERVPGRTVNLDELNIKEAATLVWRLTRIQIGLARLGISHNDLTSSNVLVNDTAYLIDFDQASVHTPLVAIIRTFFGVQLGTADLHHSFPKFAMRTLASIAKRRLPPTTIRYIKRLLGRSGDKYLPRLDAGASEAAHTLRRAWRLAQLSNASAPGQEVAYFDLSFEGYRFPGERHWDARWRVLSEITDYRSKRILELGCNMGLLSTSLLRESEAEAAMGVDIDPGILESARLIAQAFLVSPTFKVVDFDAPTDWESELVKFKPDIVFALNVLNWVNDKPRLLRFLGRFEEVILEGHEPYEVEVDRLKAYGLTTARMIALTERGRPLIHLTR